MNLKPRVSGRYSLNEVGSPTYLSLYLVYDFYDLRVFERVSAREFSKRKKTINYGKTFDKKVEKE
jgi:hypothetical protein